MQRLTSRSSPSASPAIRSRRSTSSPSPSIPARRSSLRRCRLHASSSRTLSTSALRSWAWNSSASTHPGDTKRFSILRRPKPTGCGTGTSGPICAAHCRRPAARHQRPRHRRLDKPASAVTPSEISLSGIPMPRCAFARKRSIRAPRGSCRSSDSTRRRPQSGDPRLDHMTRARSR